MLKIKLEYPELDEIDRRQLLAETNHAALQSDQFFWEWKKLLAKYNKSETVSVKFGPQIYQDEKRY